MFHLDPYCIKVRSAMSGDLLTISKSTADILGLKPHDKIDEAMARRIFQHEKALMAVAENFTRLNGQRQRAKQIKQARARGLPRVIVIGTEQAKQLLRKKPIKP